MFMRYMRWSPISDLHCNHGQRPSQDQADVHVLVQPCYLCKQTGHTTMTCPYRIAPEHGCTQAANLSSGTLLATVLQRELDGRCIQLCN